MLPFMKEKEWNAFYRFRAEYKEACIEYAAAAGYAYSQPSSKQCAAQQFSESGKGAGRIALAELQKQAALAGGTPDYPVETPIVYNHSLDDVAEKDDIKLILVGDNPGKNEQLHKNQRYLTGLAGKIANNFFKANPPLGIDFRKNVIILNKTPIHTAKTKQLSYLLKEDKTGGFRRFFEETQVFTAEKTAALQKALACPLWLVGYSELKPKGLFSVYAETLKKAFGTEKNPPLYLYQHFSMNRFLIDLKENYGSTLPLEKNLELLGLRHRTEILGF